MIVVEWEGKAYGTNRRLETNRFGTIYLNPGYESFKEGLAWLLVKQRFEKGTFKGDVLVRLEFAIGVLRDIDSLIKPVLDSIEKAGVIENDRQVKRLFVEKITKKRKDPDRIRVAIHNMGEGNAKD